MTIRLKAINRKAWEGSKLSFQKLPMVYSKRVFLLLRCVLNSAKTRQAALEGIKNVLASKMLYEFILERRMTLTDSIERCLKKGNVLIFEHKAEKGICYLLRSTICWWH